MPTYTMEDGSFNTQDGDAYTLQEGVNISLVHPVELSETEKKAWKEQLADYETIQPIEQLDRDVYRVMEDEKDTKRMERFGGSVLNKTLLLTCNRRFYLFFHFFKCRICIY